MIGRRQHAGGGDRGKCLDARHREPAVRRSHSSRGTRCRPGQRTDSGPSASDGIYYHWLAAGLVLGGAASLTIFSAGNEFLLGEIASPILAATGLHGLWRGGLCKLLVLPAWCSLVFLAALWPDFPILFIGPAADGMGLSWNAIVCIVVFLAALIIAGRTARALRRRVMAERRGVLALDHLLGATFGTAQGLFIMLALSWMMVLIEPQARVVLHHPNMQEGSTGRQIAAVIVRLTREINQTPFEPMVHEANLVERVPFIRNALCDLAEGERLTLDSMNTAGSEGEIETLPEFGPEQPVQPRPGLAGEEVMADAPNRQVLLPRPEAGYRPVSFLWPRDGTEGGYRQPPASNPAGHSAQSTVGGGS